jgi:two-component sensor histidine kinase
MRAKPISHGQGERALPLSDFGGLLNYAGESLLVGIAYFAFAKLGLLVASINPSATPIWPPSGLALAAILLRGYRISPAIFAAAFIVNMTTAGSFATSLGIAIGNILESLVGAYIINRWSGGLNTFNTPSGVARFALVCLVPSTMISATLGVGVLSLGGYASWSEFRAIWMTWWMGDLAGALVIAPVIILWATRIGLPMERNEAIQSCLIYSAAIAVGFIEFIPLFEEIPARESLSFLAILPMMWAGLRHDRRDTATTALILSCFAIWGATANSGPFVRGNLNDSFLLLLAFMISVSLPSLAMSAEVEVRKRHEEHVDFVMREVSHRSKNQLSVVQSIAGQIARRTDSFEAFSHAFGTRLRAFAQTNDLLVMDDWQGADIRDLVRAQLLPFHNADQISILAEGPKLKLNPRAAEQIGLALHELGTNATKHGALSVATGMVQIQWEIETHGTRQCLRFSWKEIGGPRIEQPQRDGFGKLVITNLVPKMLQGKAALEFEPEGVRWVLMAPSKSVLA